MKEYLSDKLIRADGKIIDLLSLTVLRSLLFFSLNRMSEGIHQQNLSGFLYIVTFQNLSRLKFPVSYISIVQVQKFTLNKSLQNEKE